MKVLDIEQLLGVKGQFVSLGNLLARVDGPIRATWQDLPASPGIYAVCLSGWQTRSFLSDGGRAKHANPEAPSRLRSKREQILTSSPTDIVYLGKTSNLRRRVKDLARFGVGRVDNHKGGEWLWQLDGIDEAQVHMWCCSRDRPKSLKCKLLDRFRAEHGDLPFANRIRGSCAGGAGLDCQPGTAIGF